ncbi:MAG: ABC transporter permease subunit [Sedimentisphaerales bacterium]|nr:ABC transporter permease subunit [Sedimentisphaerales bacterium]
MSASLSSIRYILNPVRLSGPLLDKELRVSSRRKRNYVLRFVYLILLTAFIVVVWRSEVMSQASTTFQKSRMAVAGRIIVSTIVMFQFAVTQLLAIIMLSTAISDEIYNKTLGLLMTTPISGFQIVLGKISSKLLQIVLLLAISLPLLAALRVFGGVPWDYVLSSFCITLTAAIFAGTLSLLFSISNRRAYVVIIKTVVSIGFLFGLVPAMLAALLLAPMRYASSVMNPFSTSLIFWHGLSHMSPYYAISRNTAALMSPGLPGGAFAFYWPLHCAFMLIVSALLIAISACFVRKVALRQATGQIEYAPRHKRLRRKAAFAEKTAIDAQSQGVIRRVKGWPVLWKDTRAPLIRGGEGKNSIIGLQLTVASMLLTYAMWAKAGCLNADFTHVIYTVLFVSIAVIFHIVLSASSITSEKESRSWPILLATSLGGWQILAGKAIAVARRCSVVWLLMAGHIVLFVLVGYIHPIVIVHLLMLVVWVTVFLTSSGLYFSSLCRRTTWAVVSTFGLAIALWIIAPVVLSLVGVASHNEKIGRTCMFANPAMQARVVVSGAVAGYGRHMRLSRMRFDWITEHHDVWSITVVLAITMLIYLTFGMLFAWRARRRLRRNVF